MLVLVSPAKKLDETPTQQKTATRPIFEKQAQELAGVAAKLSSADLQKLMHISVKLGDLNVERFAVFGTGQGEKAAVELFSGDTYTGLEAATLDPDEIAWAQDHFRMLSGLYGLLRPLDVIQPYRLEMGSRLKTKRGKNLYEFWHARIADALNAQAQVVGSDVLVNCASVEYFKAVDPAALKLRVITPVFMEDQQSGPKIVSFFAKKARGSMARFIIQRRLTDPEGVKEFDTGGYRYRADMSDGDRLVFLRSGS